MAHLRLLGGVHQPLCLSWLWWTLLVWQRAGTRRRQAKNTGQDRVSTSTEHDSRRWLIAAAAGALLGGAGAVGAEVIFTRRLALLFGVTATAAATVVVWAALLVAVSSQC